jgi:hypothetical protein
MATAQQPPDLNIPHSDSTVEVSIIDTTSHISLPSSLFVQPQLFEYITAPAYAFLIKHKDDTLLFDLGIRKDWENGPASVVEMVRPHADKLRIDKDVATILRENGQALEDISAIIWSHAHFDHTGDPNTFPPTTDLIVGPGFKEAFPSAFPTLPDSRVDERAWQTRTLRELEEDDDADDEDEEGQRKPMFPNLAGRERTEAEDDEVEGSSEGENTAEDAEMGEADGEGEDETVNEGTVDGEQPVTDAMVS